MEDSAVDRFRVLIIDDHPLFREALRLLLERDATLHVVAEAGSVTEALEIVRAQTIDLAIVDLVLPLGGGLALTADIKREQPRCRILGLSMHDDSRRVAAMMRAGAHGFACKAQSGLDILTAVRSVLESTRYLPPNVDPIHIARLAEAADGSPLERLTTREREVYELLVNGESNDRVATKLSIARRTVETHRQNIMKKLRVSSIAELVRLSFQLDA